MGNPSRRPLSAVYFFTTAEGKVVYIGSSKNIGGRFKSHHVPKSAYSRVFYIEVDSSDRERVEWAFISIFQPKFNVVKGVLWVPSYPEKVLDEVVSIYFDQRWDLLPPRREILNRRLQGFDVDRCCNISAAMRKSWKRKSPAERSEAARRASHARWGKPALPSDKEGGSNA